MKRLILLFSLAIIAHPSVPQAKETFAKRHEGAANRIFVPERITVGGEDNFQPEISADGRTLFYTKRIRLSHKIHKQDILTGTSEQFVSESADSKDPALSPDGRHLAFTFFKYDAKGDVCYREIKGARGEICITDNDTRDKSPFWIGKDRLGYVVEKNLDGESDVFVYDLKTRTKSLLFEGNIINPRASYDGRLLAYVKRISRGPSARTHHKLFIREVLSGAEFLVSLDTPGMSSFPAFDPEGRYIYFGHFMNDSSQDYVVDSRDTGLIMRVGLDKILEGSKTPITPEPLTSLEHNCNLPNPAAGRLFLVCAFNESLDVYSLPQDGIIPAHWGKEKLSEALQTARSYEDRIILLMTEAYRDPSSVNKTYYERLLSANYHIGELNTCFYLLNRLKDISSGGEDSALYGTALELIAAEIEYLGENPALIRESYRKKVRSRLIKLDKTPSSSRPNAGLTDAVKGALLTLLADNAQASKMLERPGMERLESRFAAYVRIKYLEILYKRKGDDKGLAELYFKSSNRDFDVASKVYYAHKLLEHADGYRTKARVEAVKSYLERADTQSPAHALLYSETLLEKLTASRDEKESKLYYDGLYINLQNSNTPYLRRALMIRAIKRLSDGAMWRHMYYISNFWLSNTDKEAVEYIYAKDQYLFTSLDKAYGLWGDGEKSFAADEFYIALRLTDNLEAHHGYIVSMIEAGKGSEIRDKYAFLRSRGFTSENAKYLDAYLKVRDPVKKSDTLSKSSIGAGIRSLEALKTPIDYSGVRNLLLGYLYYKKIDYASKQAEIKALADQAYRNLMLSLDLARFNLRIKKQALMNLALLYQKTGNFGESLSFLVSRKELPFASKEEEVYFLWFYARSLYYNSRHLEASEAVSQALGIIENEGLAIPKRPFVEKTAFYALSAGDYLSARKTYEGLLGENTDEVEIKILSSYAFALYMLGELDLAKQNYLKLRSLSKNMGTPRKKAGVLFIRPQVFEIQSLGFLALLEDDIEKRIELRSDRLALLKALKGDTVGYGYGKDDWRRLTVKEINNLAADLHASGRSDKALSEILKSIPLIEDLYESTLNPLDDAHLITVRNAMSLFIRNSAGGAKIAKKLAKRIVALALACADLLKDTREVSLSSRYLKLKAETAIFERAAAVGHPDFMADDSLKAELKALKGSIHWSAVANSQAAKEDDKEILMAIESWL